MPDIAVSFSRMAYDPTVKNYKTFLTKSGLFESLAPHLTTAVWSPIVWRDGVRLQDNFLHTDLIGLDFDDGELTLEAAIEFFKNADLRTIIGTTKSHQKEKRTPSGSVSPACDRFRVIIEAERCDSLADYRYTNHVFMNNLPADKSCKDGGRYFAPCREIVWQGGSVRAKWLTAPPKPKPVKKEFASTQMPNWVRQAINVGPGVNESRHRTCYAVGAELSKLGWDVDTITETIMRGPMSAIGRGDVVRAVENGIAAAERDFV